MSTVSAPELTPIEVELLDFLSYVYLRIEEPAKAAALLAIRQSHAARTGAPVDVRASLALAVARVRNAQPRKALRVLEELAQQLPSIVQDARYHLARAQAHSAAGEHDAAVIAMRAYVERRPLSQKAEDTYQQTFS
jgi:outer membrane PBP1 activator LpoA protein